MICCCFIPTILRNYMDTAYESPLDQTNRRLLAELEADARVSVAELGRRIGLSAPAVSERIGRLERAGRPVESAGTLPDRLLWAAYRLARCTLSPSLNEGLGLPLSESLSAGTPAITSDFGSMREIAEGGGALLVNPREDDELTAALERMLTDDLLVSRLRDEARARSPWTWSDYAEQLWELFHG